MSKVTSKLQITIPKAVATKCGISPGDHIDWQTEGRTIKLIPKIVGTAQPVEVEERLRLFDEATARVVSLSVREAQASRGWTREELYDRDSTR